MPVGDILLMTPCLKLKDAVGHDVIKQYKHLEIYGYSCFIYTENRSSRLEEFNVVSEAYVKLLARNRKILVIYHHCVYWKKGQELLESIKASTIVKFHNITPPYFFKPYDRESYYSTIEGQKQTARLVTLPFIVKFVADSRTNISELVQIGLCASKIDLIPPFTCIHDFTNLKSSQSVVDYLSDYNKNILFVGRIVPNKGIHHLISVLDSYVKYFDSSVRLTIIGSFPMKDNLYYRELEDRINQSFLGSNICFWQHTCSEDLATIYRCSDAFLICSEHEGFCVPILEAQSMDLPIVALKRSAVAETIGPKQLAFEKMDPNVFATALHRVFYDQDLREYVASYGRQNIAKYDEKIISKMTRELIGRTVLEIS